jgi:gas vesicle protein
MRNKNNKNIKPLLIGSLIGGQAGATVGLLITPQSREETITQIQDKSISLKEDAIQKIEESRIYAAGQINIAREIIADLVEQGCQALAENAEVIRP